MQLCYRGVYHFRAIVAGLGAPRLGRFADWCLGGQPSQDVESLSGRHLPVLWSVGIGYTFRGCRARQESRFVGHACPYDPFCTPNIGWWLVWRDLPAPRYM